jgi:(1->4)-alpha-D-glucan 1-alpha-D-glucosylmutase
VTAIGAMTPVSTYRLQFGSKFRLPDALDLVPYLDALGVSHVYASPLLKARPGSEHGYDITDHNAINPEIGTWDDFVRFTDALRACGMGLVLDFVPNHMGIGKADNAWWLDVLEAGQGSLYADFFDIDWAPQRRELRAKVLLPILGAHYGAVLTGGELVLRFDAEGGTLSVWYHEHRLPLRARSYAAVIRRQLARGNDTGLDETVRASLKQLADAFDRVRRASRRRREDAHQHAAKLKSELAALCRAHAAAAGFMDAAAAAFTGTKGDAESFRPMHALMERQFYRLAYWRVAADEINYRRFFNINELAGVRMENHALFEKAHALVGRMIAEGRLHGLRLDHIDGLFDPEAYCRRLQSFASAQRPENLRDQAPFYIVVEKIVAYHEALRPNWPIAGTTGYEFANLVNGLFVDPAGAEGCARAYGDFAGASPPFDELVLAAKDIVIDSILPSELAVLADELDRISERHWNTRDFARRRLREALKAVVRQFPVYRTYVSGRGVSPEDRRDIDWAVGRARRAWHGADREILDFVHEALTGDLARRGAPFRRADVLRFAMHFQQYTGPVMAKSLEDTAFYRHHRLIALNEVGGDPRQFGVSVAAFHHANRERARHWPHSMLATSTHDTKRGEDARLRIDVISEIPEEWGRRAARWSELNRALRREVDGAPAPSRNDEYLLYQALLGAWPADFIAEAPNGDALARFARRLQQFLLKAMREAKLESSWENPNQAYEEAALAFARELLERSPNPFLADFSDFAARAARFAMMSGISQTVLRLTAPGVPDTYQGAEVWNASLVDPDNRAPVDFAGLQRLADCSTNRSLAALMAQWIDGGLKLRLTATLLKLRREHAELFLGGGYEPLRAEGPRADHVVAFTRADHGRDIAIVAGRLFVRLLGWESERYDGGVWRETILAWPEALRGIWRDALSDTRFEIGGEQMTVEPLLAHLPAAVLVRGGT